MSLSLTYSRCILFLLAVLSIEANAQIPINCGGINKIIPHFVEHTSKKFDSEPLVKRGILVPINQSESSLEIRLYSYSELNIATIFYYSV